MAQTTLENAAAEDVMSVGTRISWGAIVAGALLALAFQFLFSILGAAVGVAVSDRVRVENIRTGALIWVVVTTCVSLFVGGMIISLFTVGENKVEAVLYGIIMWALLIAILIGLGAAGARAGLTAVVGAVDAAQGTSEEGWMAAAKKAGVSEQTISEWEKQITGAGKEAKTTDTKEAIIDASKTATWYTFGGIWLSMFAAAAGALVGAGPTFRLVRVERSGVRVIA